MKNLRILLLIILFFGCNNDKDDVIYVPPTQNLEVEDFVYKAMNTFYYWQEEVANLSDNKFADDKEYTAFLGSFDGPEDLFNNLTYSGDKFSVITDDYVTFEKQLNSIALSNGMKFGLGRISQSDTSIFGYVRYVLPNTDAEQKGIKRGDIFTHVSGTQLTINNYRDLLFSNTTSYTIDLATLNNQTIQPIGVTVTLTNTEQQEKELHLKKVIAHEGNKVGYVMYNGFANSQEDDLKDAFTDFAAQQIDELIVDLRYNPGGAVQTAQLLAGLIAGEHAGKTFGKMIYNKKLSDYDRDIEITNSNVNLGLSRVIFIVTSGSASASEMVINGLNPYMTTVLVGSKTSGKNVGSFLVHDIIDNKGTKNPNHQWALLPITFGFFNSIGFGDYANGFSPNVAADEDLGSLGVLGETNEPLLKKALEVISGQLSSDALTTKKIPWSFNEVPIEEGMAIYSLPMKN